MKNLLIFALIPLVLSLGIISVLPLSYSEELRCPVGEVETVRINTSKSVCIDQSTAIRWQQLGIAEIIGEPTQQPIETIEKSEKESIPPISQQEDSSIEKSTVDKLPLGIETIETRSGTITIDHDYLTPESAKLLSDELFFQRAVQVYHLALPAVGGAGIFYEQGKVGATTGDIIYWSDFMNSDIELLTGNTSVLYYMTLQDLSDGPIVVHVPEGNLQGHIDNIYQQVITDYGIVGPNEGNEASFLILPPNYDGEIPSEYNGETENHFVEQSDTMRFIAMGRAFVNSPDMAAAEELIKKVNVYNLSEIDDSPQVQFFDVSGESLKLSHPQTEGFWEFLHEVYSKETVIRPEDKNLVGLMHTIGIVPGEPFETDEHSKEILDKAAVVADLMARNIAYDSPVKEPFLYWPDKNWELAFMTKNPRYEDERGATQIEPRLSFMYQAITTADAMVLELVGMGSKYVGTYRDADENFLIGSNTYHLNIPADVPAENFWSIVVYDAETRSMIKNDVQPLPAIRSLDSDKLLQNEDGSYDVYFGPEAPEGYENNWVKTNEGDGFFVFMRFYSPTEAYYDKSWQLPMVELVESGWRTLFDEDQFIAKSQSNLLPSWNNGNSKQKIIEFVDKVTDPSSTAFVPAADRIATFDNDGTLWIEQPLYIPFAFHIEYLYEQLEEDPSLGSQSPYREILENKDSISNHDLDTIPGLADILIPAYPGITQEEYLEKSKNYLNDTKHVRYDVALKELTYLPMVELVSYLQENDFKVYIVSAGFQGLMRSVSEEAYNIEPENVIGTHPEFVYQPTENGPVVIRQPEIASFDDGPEKPVNIQKVIGKIPIFACGNSGGDIEMLMFTHYHENHFGCMLNHDDEQREYYYPNAEALEASEQNEWLVISMKDDFKLIFENLE